MYKERIYANESKTSLNYTNLLHVIFGSFFNLLPFLFFYYNTLKDGSILIKWGLGLSLLLPLLATISNAGRNGLIVFLILIFSSYILFKNFYSIRKKRIINLIIIILTSSIVSLIITISIARFANREGDNPVLHSIISYSGQSSLNFNEYIFTAKSHELGDNSFPLVRMLLGLEYSTSPIIRQLKWESTMGIPLHVFYTFVGDFCLDFGPFIALLFIIIISSFISKNITYNSKGITKLHDIFLVYFVFNICAQGVFYFMSKTIGGNLSIITFILVYILIKHFLFTSNGKSISILSPTISPNSRK
jgi:oligosaccharide repeat unit polymerase